MCGGRGGYCEVRVEFGGHVDGGVEVDEAEGEEEKGATEGYCGDGQEHWLELNLGPAIKVMERDREEETYRVLERFW